MTLSICLLANEISKCCVNASTSEILAKLRAQPENNIILSMLGSKTKIRTYQLKETLEDSVGDDVIFEYLKIVATSMNDKNIKVTSPGELITDETYLPKGTQNIEELMALDLLISCNVHNYHWTLTAVFPKQKMISHLNPMGEEVSALNGVLNKWNAYLERKYGLKEIWPLQTIPHAKQQDSVSCGIFCAKFAECIMSNQKIPVEFTKNEVIEFRNDIVRKLLQEGEKDETWHLKFCRLCGSLDGPKKNKGQTTDRWVHIYIIIADHLSLCKPTVAVISEGRGTGLRLVHIN
ncbi:uncharacterized protein LOC130648947 [Hydractinia symbiolongicarpus]|uniref:uncharacterized protein LOC130648947 n=1 Tax=Hydractinia symbiolongicarpus TaxID=13093 RepID=UPI00254ED339|nr:uncharacterized protein LOC130648947 [Hydractinia symbiolongicarpus]XP_057311074.1 uncharacterized protein LOC130648947 [Hydractinia symbiolongicarpus]